jgi:transposase
MKRQSNEWKHPGHPHPNKLCPTQSSVKAMLIVTADIDGVILHHTVSRRESVNAANYGSFLCNHLRPALRRKQKHLLPMKAIFLHDNARAHTADAVKDRLRRWRWEMLENPPYSPDMSPTCILSLLACILGFEFIL